MLCITCYRKEGSEAMLFITCKHKSNTWHQLLRIGGRVEWRTS